MTEGDKISEKSVVILRHAIKGQWDKIKPHKEPLEHVPKNILEGRR